MVVAPSSGHAFKPYGDEKVPLLRQDREGFPAKVWELLLLMPLLFSLIPPAVGAGI